MADGEVAIKTSLLKNTKIIRNNYARLWTVFRYVNEIADYFPRRFASIFLKMIMEFHY